MDGWMDAVSGLGHGVPISFLAGGNNSLINECQSAAFWVLHRTYGLIPTLRQVQMSSLSKAITAPGRGGTFMEMFDHGALASPLLSTPFFTTFSPGPARSYFASGTLSGLYDTTKLSFPKGSRFKTVL